MSTTLKKALNIIEFLANQEEPRSISELSRHLKMSKSNMHFLLATLFANGYVEQDVSTKKYSLTIKLWELGTRVLGRLDLRRVASPFLAFLAEATSETVNLAILDHDEVVYIHKIDSPKPVRAYTPEGRRAPAYCTSTGKAMLAHESAEVIKRVASTIERHTERTVTSLKDLRIELQKIRQIGYSMNRGEWRDSVRGVAVPIFNSSGKVIAAVGIFGPAERLPARSLDRLATMVMKTGTAISSALGYKNSS